MPWNDVLYIIGIYRNGVKGVSASVLGIWKWECAQKSNYLIDSSINQEGLTNQSIKSSLV